MLSTVVLALADAMLPERLPRAYGVAEPLSTKVSDLLIDPLLPPRK